MEVVEVDGQLIEMGGEIGVYNENYLSYQKNGVEFNIYSSKLTAYQMLEILSAMEVVSMK